MENDWVPSIDDIVAIMRLALERPVDCPFLVCLPSGDPCMTLNPEDFCNYDDASLFVSVMKAYPGIIQEYRKAISEDRGNLEYPA